MIPWRELAYTWLYPIAVLLIIGLIAVGLALLTDQLWPTTPAQGHSLYPKECCAGDNTHGDCRPIDCDGITEQRGGVEWRGIFFSSDKVRASFNQQCHVCISNQPHCIFIQPNS
jgi:hypothetical protein